MTTPTTSYPIRLRDGDRIEYGKCRALEWLGDWMFDSHYGEELVVELRKRVRAREQCSRAGCLTCRRLCILEQLIAEGAL